MKKNVLDFLSKVFTKSALLKAYFICITTLLSFAVSAQNTFNVTTGNWNTAGNWSLGHVPNGTESLLIPSGNTCNMDVNYTGGNTAFTLTISGTLNIPSGISFDKPAGTVLMNANGATLSGGGNINLYILTVNTANASDVVNITNSSASAPVVIGKSNTAGTINFTNGLLKLTGQTLAIAKTATINGNGGNFANSTYADGGTILLQGSSGGTTTVNGSVTFNNIDFGTDGNVVVDLKTNTSKINGIAKIVNQQGKLGSTNSPIWGDSSTLNISYNSGFNYTPGKEWVSMASGIIGTTPGYPNNVILSNTGNSGGGFNNGNGWVPSGAWAINGVLTLGNNSTNAQIDFSNVSSFICGGFVLNSNSRFTAPKATMTVNGSWTDNQAVSGTSKGFFINGTSTVVFGGAASCIAPSTITGPGGNLETFNNLTIAANVNLNSPVATNLTGVVTITSGILTTTSSNLLTINNTAIIALIGGSSSSYINGPVKRNIITNAAIYTFPVGSGTCTSDYLPLILNKAVGSATSITVQAITPGSGGTVDATLSSLSTTEYWSLISSADLTGSTISIVRPLSILPLSLIGKSNTTATGVYTSIGGTPILAGINNSNDIGAGTTLFFSLAVPPIVSTLFPTSITTTTATLQGAFNTLTASHPTSFNYGTTISYGTNISTIHSPIISITSVADSAFITGLIANTEYHVIATDGTNSGSDVKFFTAPNPPVIAPATNLSGSGFTSNWSAPASQGSAPFTYTVQISTDPTFATGVTEQTSIGSGATSSPATGLTSATTYYIRVKAVNETTSSVWSSVATVTTNLVPTPPCTNNTSSDGATTFTAQAPVIDGTVDAIWSNPPANSITQTVLGNNNNTQTWQSMWTADSLYLLVQVTDASLIGQGAGLQGSVVVPGVTQGSSGNYYEADGIEFYLDADRYNFINNISGYDAFNDIQLRFNLGSTSLSGQSAGGTAQFAGAAFARVAPLVDWKMVVTPTGYLLEAAIPWGKDAANPGIFLLPTPPNTYGTPTNGQVIGIDIGINDQDNAGGGRQAQVQWNGNSTGSYQDARQFKPVALQICPEPPTVTTPTKTLITATSAQLGATVVSSGKDGGVISPLTTRGTAYSTVNPVYTNALAEGGNTLGIYSNGRTNLAPQTKYYYVGYANNAAGLTGVSSVDSFFTLSALPTTAPQLTTVICPGITLNWSAITFPPANQATQTGYLVLRRQDGNNPTSTGIVTGVATKQADLPAGTTLLATIPSGATLTYTDASVVGGTTYNYLLVPFTWDGVATDSTYNYAIGQGSATTSATATGAAITTPTFTQIAPICAGGTFTLLTTSNNGVTGTWSPAINNQGTTLYTFTPDQGQCATLATMSVTVNQPIAPSFTQIAPICAGGTFTLLTTSNNGVTGTWSPAINNQGTTLYTFTPSQGQCATTATMSVTVNQPTPTSFTQIPPICADGTFSLPTTSTNGVTGTWSPAINNQGTTLYTFTPSQGQCATTATMSVTVFTKPTVTASADPTTVGSGGTVTLTGTSSVDGTYSWTASPQTLIGSSNTTTATSNPTANTIYTFTVNYGQGCSASDDVTVAFNDLKCFDPMKAFTPNGDGKNEKWQVYRDVTCFANVQVDVYNRWGGLVYHADHYNNDWTGQYKGNNVPDATYYYVIKATDASGYTQVKTGNVTIIR